MEKETPIFASGVNLASEPASQQAFGVTEAPSELSSGELGGFVGHVSLRGSLTPNIDSTEPSD